MIKFKSVKYMYGAKGATRSVAFFISPELKDEMYAIAKKGERSSWVERWLWLAVALQNSDITTLIEWAAWAKENLDVIDRMELRENLAVVRQMLDV